MVNVLPNISAQASRNLTINRSVVKRPDLVIEFRLLEALSISLTHVGVLSTEPPETTRLRSGAGEIDMFTSVYYSKRSGRRALGKRTEAIRTTSISHDKQSQPEGFEESKREIYLVWIPR